MTHKNFIIDLNWQRFSQNMGCPCHCSFLDFCYVWISRDLLWIFVCTFFYCTKSVHNYRCQCVVLGATLILFRFPCPCILIFFQILYMASSYTVVVSMIFNYNVIFLSVCIVKSQRVVVISVSTTVSGLCSYQKGR